MPALEIAFPFDRAAELLLIVVAGVGLLALAASGAAWLLRRHPAARHLVLLSGLIGCMAVLPLALVSLAAGVTLVALPVLPDAAEPVATPRAVPAPLEPGRTDLAAFGRSGGAGAIGRPQQEFEPFGAKPGTGAGDGSVDADSVLPIAHSEARVAASEPQAAVPAETAKIAVPAADDATTGFSGWLVVLAVWLGGSGLLLCGLGRSLLRIVRLRRTAAPADPRALAGLMDDVVRVLALEALPPVLVSPRVGTALAAGFFRPAIYLPAGLLGTIRRDQLRDVLIHEAAHIARRDQWVVVLQGLARALYWPVLPLHVLNRELGQAREELCDNVVLACRDAIHYGETLLCLAELSLGARPVPASVGILHWRGRLEQRIAGLLDGRRSRLTRTSRWLTCALLLSFGLAGLLAAGTRLVQAEGEQPAAEAATPAAEETESTSAADGTGDGAKTDAGAKTGAGRATEAAPEIRTMRVRVLGPDGEPEPEAHVQISVWTNSPKKPPTDYTTDAQGEVLLSLPAQIDILRIWAKKTPLVPLFVNFDQRVPRAPALPDVFTFRLEAGTIIGGTIVDDDGTPVEGARVEASLDVPEKLYEARYNTWLTEDRDPVLTDAEGRWTLDNVPAGDEVVLRLKLHHPQFIDDEHWGGLQREQQVTLRALRDQSARITMHRGTVIAGQVTDPSGQPVPDAIVIWGNDPYMDTDGQEVRTDQQGRYRVPPMPHGPLAVTVVAEGWMPALREVDVKSEMPDVDFQLQPGKLLRVRITDQSGAAVPDAYVSIQSWRGRKSLYNHRHSSVLDTKIPWRGDASGVYEWTWAPDDAVRYGISAKGYADTETTLTADGSEQTYVLHRELELSGRVTDASTGGPVSRFIAVPVLQFRPNLLSVQRQEAVEGRDGQFRVELSRSDYPYRLRIEAEGYRPVESGQAWSVGDDVPPLEFALAPAPPLAGRVLGPDGAPAAGKTVALGTTTQSFWHDAPMMNFTRTTDSDGRFSFPAQLEPATLVVRDDDSFAESRVLPGAQPATLQLAAWGTIRGRVVESGKPVPGVTVRWSATRPEIGNPVNDALQTQTETDGSFILRRVPPIPGSVSPSLTIWSEAPITSARSVPLALRPGETVEVSLGGSGRDVAGRVMLKGNVTEPYNYTYAINYLLAVRPGIEPPEGTAITGLDWRDGWDPALRTNEGHAHLKSRHHHFVKLRPDGTFLVSGVEPGDYDLALDLYEPPVDGCLVQPIGRKVVRLTVPDGDGPQMLDPIEVEAVPSVRDGDLAPDFAFETNDGSRRLSNLRGRFVVLDVWATWCLPCLSALERLQALEQELQGRGNVSFVGLSLDEDRSRAREVIEQRGITWGQAYLGAWEQSQVAAEYGVSTVPLYILVGPDGRVLRRTVSDEELRAVLLEALEAPPAAAATQAPTEAKKDEPVWGEAKDGLRLAAVPESVSVRMGEYVPFELIVENVSDGDIAFTSIHGLHLKGQARAEIRFSDGDQVQTQQSKMLEHLYLEPVRHVLKPKQRVVLAVPSVIIVQDPAENIARSPGSTAAIIRDGQSLRKRVVQVRYQLSLGNTRTAPIEGEWSGTLVSGTVAIAASRPPGE